MPKKHFNNKAFSLTELLVAAALAAIVALGLYHLIIQINRASITTQDRLYLTTQANLLIKSLNNDLQNAVRENPIEFNSATNTYQPLTNIPGSIIALPETDIDGVFAAKFDAFEIKLVDRNSEILKFKESAALNPNNLFASKRIKVTASLTPLKPDDWILLAGPNYSEFHQVSSHSGDFLTLKNPRKAQYFSGNEILKLNHFKYGVDLTNPAKPILVRKNLVTNEVVELLTDLTGFRILYKYVNDSQQYKTIGNKLIEGVYISFTLEKLSSAGPPALTNKIKDYLIKFHSPI